MTASAHNFEYAHPFPPEVRKSWTNSSLVKAIHRSQHTQRNFNRDKEIPIEDIKTIITAATQCPSKHNLAFYDLHIIQNRDVIDELYNTTTNMYVSKEEQLARELESLSNPQVLANLVLVFTKSDYTNSSHHIHKNLKDLVRSVNSHVNNREILKADMNQAVGIAAGYVNIVATLLGYETGYCRCVMDKQRLLSILEIDKKVPIILIMGIGFKNNEMNRRSHPLKGSAVHKDNKWKNNFITIKKEPIKIKYIK